MDLGFAFYKSEFNKVVFKTFVQILNVTFFSVITQNTVAKFCHLSVSILTSIGCSEFI